MPLLKWKLQGLQEHDDHCQHATGFTFFYCTAYLGIVDKTTFFLLTWMSQSLNSFDVSFVFLRSHLLVLQK